MIKPPSPSNPPDDALVHVEAVLRQAPVPLGPSEEWKARTLAALQAADMRPRLFQWPRLLRMAAMFLIAAAGLVALAEFLQFGQPLAFAQVAQKLRDANTLTFQMTVEFPGLDQKIVYQAFLKGSDWVRMESSDGKLSIGQTNENKIKSLSLDPANKMALLLGGKKGSHSYGPAKVDPIQQMRQLIEKQSEPAGKKQIGDVRAEGFKVKEEGLDLMVWADPATRLPVVVEINIPNNEGHITLANFRFNPPLADALFSLEVPKGYKLQAVETQDLPPEEAIVQLLREYANTPGGKLPPKLDDPKAFGLHLREVRGDKAGPSAVPGPEDIRYLMNATRVWVFLQHNLQGRYGYRPDGAKLGDASRLIFWYRPAGATRHRGLYADMHWADLTTDQLPEAPKS